MAKIIYKSEKDKQKILSLYDEQLRNLKIKSVMPQNENAEQLRKYKNPVLVMVEQKDCLFPAKNVIPQVKSVWQQSVQYLLKDRGHINNLISYEKR